MFQIYSFYVAVPALNLNVKFLVCFATVVMDFCDIFLQIVFGFVYLEFLLQKVSLNFSLFYVRTWNCFYFDIGVSWFVIMKLSKYRLSTHSLNKPSIILYITRQTEES